MKFGASLNKKKKDWGQMMLHQKYTLMSAQFQVDANNCCSGTDSAIPASVFECDTQ
jgi:hypothetical protein